MFALEKGHCTGGPSGARSQVSTRQLLAWLSCFWKLPRACRSQLVIAGIVSLPSVDPESQDTQTTCKGLRCYFISCLTAVKYQVLNRKFISLLERDTNTSCSEQ